MDPPCSFRELSKVEDAKSLAKVDLCVADMCLPCLRVVVEKVESP